MFTQPQKRRGPATEEEKQRAIKLYNAGGTVRSVAAEVGRSTGWVGRVIDEAEIARPRSVPRTEPDPLKARAVELYASLRSIRKVAAQIGKGHNFVHCALREADQAGRSTSGRLRRVA
ncbi:helix-turn-helix domain-containing protein [Streptomyces sp. NPDC002851]